MEVIFLECELDHQSLLRFQQPCQRTVWSFCILYLSDGGPFPGTWNWPQITLELCSPHFPWGGRLGLKNVVLTPWRSFSRNMNFTTNHCLHVIPKVWGLSGACVFRTYLMEVHFQENQNGDRSLFTFVPKSGGCLGLGVWCLPHGGHFPGTHNWPQFTLDIFFPQSGYCLGLGMWYWPLGGPLPEMWSLPPITL